jgi:hypothetical protein
MSQSSKLPDYPAAHSMDTMWFAVDADGNVAAFETGESGAVPKEAYLGEEWGPVVNAILGREEDADCDDFEAELADRGVFVYGQEADNWTAGSYVLENVPDHPVRAADLPRSVRESMIKFAGQFPATPRLQPVEIWPCESWGPSYLASDDKTVKPMPGRETEYAEEYKMAAEARAADDGVVWTPPGQTKARDKRPWWKIW